MNKGIMPSGSMNTSNMEASIRLPQHPVWHKSWRRTVRVCERELHPQGMLRYGSREQIQSGVHFLKKKSCTTRFFYVQENRVYENKQSNIQMGVLATFCYNPIPDRNKGGKVYLDSLFLSIIVGRTVAKWLLPGWREHVVQTLLIVTDQGVDRIRFELGVGIAFQDLTS